MEGERVLGAQSALQNAGLLAALRGQRLLERRA